MLRWDWKRKQGELEYDKFHLDLYDGNVLFMGLFRDKLCDDGEWQYGGIPLFFDDDVHAKRCLGLAKGYDDMFEGIDVKLTLYRKMWDKAELKKIVSLLAQRMGNTTIEIKEK